MFTASAPSSLATSIDTELFAGDVLVTSMSGHVTRAVAEERFRQFRARLGFLREPRWIIEQSRMTGFDPSAVAAGDRWFKLFRAQGGKDVVIVSHLAGARMVAASLAFAVRINISSCADLATALALLDLRQPSSPDMPIPPRHDDLDR